MDSVATALIKSNEKFLSLFFIFITTLFIRISEIRQKDNPVVSNCTDLVMNCYSSRDKENRTKADVKPACKTVFPNRVKA